MLIKYANGLIQEGLLVSLRGNQLRAATKNGDDLLEFTLVEGIWVSESCEPVTFDFTVDLLESIGFVRGTEQQIAPSTKSNRFVN